MSFHFVDMQAMSPADRRHIRSHVMLGRNAGRKLGKVMRRRQTRGPSANEKRLVARGCRREPESSSSKQEIDHIAVHASHGQSVKDATIPRSVGHSLSASGFPGDIDPQGCSIMHQVFGIISAVMYPEEFCKDSALFRGYWMRYFFIDETFLHASMAIADRVVCFVHKGGQASTVSLVRMSKALNLLHRMLSGGDALSDHAIAIVCSFSLTECLSNNIIRFGTHISGLFKMVQLRGGPAAFKHDSPLQHKIFQSDIEYALQSGSNPRFHHDESPREFHITYTDDEADVEGSALLEIFNNAPVALGEIAKVCLMASRFFNHCRKGPKLSALAFQNLILHLFYRLMETDPLRHHWPATALQNTAHLALLSLAMQLRYQATHRHYTSVFSLHASRIRTMMDDAWDDGPKSGGLMLWLLFMTAMSVPDDALDQMLLTRVSHVCVQMKLLTWDDVRMELLQLPWIESIHGQRTRKIWTQSISSLY